MVSKDIAIGRVICDRLQYALAGDTNPNEVINPPAKVSLGSGSEHRKKVWLDRLIHLSLGKNVGSQSVLGTAIPHADTHQRLGG